MPRILHAAETIQGGVGAHLEEIIPRQIAALGSDAVRVLLPADERHFFPGIPQVAVKPFDRPGGRLRNTRALAEAVAGQVAAFGPDIVHAHSTFAGAAVRLPRLAARHRPGIVYCPHGWSFAADGRLRRRVFSLAERVMDRAADAIINVSNYERDLAASLGLDARKLRVLRNGVADGLVAGPVPDGFDPDRLNFVFVGRLDQQKGFDVLVAAARRTGPGVHFHVVGSAVRDGPAATDFPPNMTLHGWQSRDRAAAFLAAADAVVMPSRWEGLPLVALEAMRAGRAILASDRSAMPEVVADGVNGRLFAIEPDGASLARLIATVSRADLERWGAAGRQRFEREFTVERQSAEILALYDEVLAGRIGSAR